MGADFLLALAPVPDGSPEQIADLHARVDLVPESILEEIIGACLDEDEDGFPEAKALLHEAIDEILGTSRRDVSHLTLGGITYVATGGMSWGDGPTDAWRYVLALDFSELTRGLETVRMTPQQRCAIARAIADARAATGGNPVLLHGTELVIEHVAEMFADEAADFDRETFLHDCGLTPERERRKP